MDETDASYGTPMGKYQRKKDKTKKSGHDHQKSEKRGVELNAGCGQ